MQGPFCLVPAALPAWALKEFPRDYRRTFIVERDVFGYLNDDSSVGAGVRVRLPYNPARIPDDAVAIVRYNNGAPGT